jgi:hypothetical protein
VPQTSQFQQYLPIGSNQARGAHEPGLIVCPLDIINSEEISLDIRLKESRRVHTHGIAVALTQVNLNDRMRLKRFINARTAMHIEEPALIDQLLIRA